MIKRRIVPRSSVTFNILVAKAPPTARICPRTITLDGTTYRCGRQAYGAERSHEGIHDAFETHGDGGSVRW